MRTSGVLNDGTATGYGAGLRLDEHRSLPVVSHDGADGGYRAEAVLFPDQGLAIVALCNGAALAPTRLTREVAEIYLGDLMTDPAPPPAAATPPAEQRALAGVYWSAQTDEVVRLEWRDGALRQPGSSVGLVPTGGGGYRPDDQAAHQWLFTAPAAGAPDDAPPQLRIKDFWPTWRGFVRVDSPIPTGLALEPFAGRYRSDETDMTYTARVDDGRVSLTWPRGYAVALEPVGGDRFVGSIGTVTFTRGVTGEVDGLTISNRRLRRLRADRVPEAPPHPVGAGQG
jgi:hypothetical protein